MLAKSSVKIEEINVMQPEDVDDNYILVEASSSASQMTEIHSMYA